MLTKAKIKHLPSVANLAELREIFNLVDRDNSGTITGDELQILLETIGIHVKIEEIQLMFHIIDIDGDEEISFDEFVSFMSRRLTVQHTPDEIKHAFTIFNSRSSDQDGIHIDNILEALTEYGTEPLTKERAKELLKNLEANVNGNVNFIEYIDTMLNW